jgi:hypothetical protein
MAVLAEPNFPLVAGETPGSRIVRIAQSYVGCALHDPVHPTLPNKRLDELAALIGRGVDDESVVSIKTNCAMFALGVLRAAGVVHPRLSQKYVDGMAFAWLIEIGNSFNAWRPGESGPLSVGAILHYAVQGENDDHAEVYVSASGPMHCGGGRADNAITQETGPVTLSLGRPISQWLDPDALGLEVVESAAGPTSEPHV